MVSRKVDWDVIRPDFVEVLGAEFVHGVEKQFRAKSRDIHPSELISLLYKPIFVRVIFF